MALKKRQNAYAYSNRNLNKKQLDNAAPHNRT